MTQSRRRAPWYAAYVAAIFLVVPPMPANACGGGCHAFCWLEWCGQIYIPIGYNYYCAASSVCEYGWCMTLSPGFYGECNIVCTESDYQFCNYVIWV